jgi:hypothetical protein
MYNSYLQCTTPEEAVTTAKKMLSPNTLRDTTTKAMDARDLPKCLMNLSPAFRGIASCTIGSGKSALFWKDDWNKGIMQEKYPCLFSYVQHEDISVADFCTSHSISDMFQLPLSPEAFSEWEQLQVTTDSLLQVSNEEDMWKYEWGTTYTAKSFYNFCFR